MLTHRFFVDLASRLAAAERFYIAVGAGDAAWDTAVPEDDRSVARLTAEVARRLVRPGDVVFLDAGGEVTAEPSPRLRFRAKFVAGGVAGPLREVGLFAAASGAPNSGTLLAYHVHPRIEILPSSGLRRSLTIDLTPRPYAPGSRVTRYLGNVRTREFHDLDRVSEHCLIHKIHDDNRFYLSGLQQAEEMGYDCCAYCFGKNLSKR